MKYSVPVTKDRVLLAFLGLLSLMICTVARGEEVGVGQEAPFFLTCFITFWGMILDGAWRNLKNKKMEIFFLAFLMS